MLVEVPVPLTAPGLRVQLPAGKLFSTTDPVARVQVGCVMVPATGVAGNGLMVMVSVAVVAHWLFAGVNV